MSQSDERGGEDLKSYVIGGLVSAVLTALSFAVLATDLSTGAKVAVICGAALLQIAAHLRFFLHLRFSERQAREDLLLVLFSVSLLAIMAGGTIWILTDLHGRMHNVVDGEAPGHEHHFE